MINLCTSDFQQILIIIFQLFKSHLMAHRAYPDAVPGDYSSITLQRTTKDGLGGHDFSIPDVYQSIPITPESVQGQIILSDDNFDKPSIQLRLDAQKSSHLLDENSRAQAGEDLSSTIDQLAVNKAVAALSPTRKKFIDKIEIETTNIFAPTSPEQAQGVTKQADYMLVGDLYRRAVEGKKHFRRSSNVPISRMDMVFDEGRDDLDSRTKSFHSGKKLLKGGQRANMRPRVSLIPFMMDSFKLTQNDINASTEKENNNSSHQFNSIHRGSPTDLNSTKNQMLKVIKFRSVLEQPFDSAKRKNINTTQITQGMNEHEMYNFYVCWLGRENDQKNTAFLREQQGYKNFKVRKNRHLRSSLEFKQHIRNANIKPEHADQLMNSLDKLPNGQTRNLSQFHQKKMSLSKNASPLKGQLLNPNSFQTAKDFTKIQMNERLSTQLIQSQNQPERGDLVQQLLFEPLCVQSRGLDKYLKKPPTPAPAKSVRSRQQVDKMNQQTSLNAPTSLLTGVASTQEHDRGEVVGSAPNSIPSRPGSKVHVAGAVLSNKTLFSQHTGSFGSQSQFHPRGILQPRGEAPQISSGRKEPDDAFFSASIQNRLNKQNTEYLPHQPQKSETKPKAKDTTRSANQGQIIKGLTHQKKEEIIVYTKPQDMALVNNKNLHSPGLFGLSSSLYLNESHGTYKQAMSSKNKDINHLSDESFGQEGRGAQLSDISISNMYSRHLIMSQKRKKDQQRHMTSIKMEKIDLDLLSKNTQMKEVARLSPGHSAAVQSGNMSQSKNSVHPDRRGQHSTDKQLGHNQQQSNGKLRKIVAESIQDHINAANPDFLNANQDEIMTLKDIAVKTPNIDIAQSGQNDLSKESSKDMLEQIYSKQNLQKKLYEKTQANQVLKLASQADSSKDKDAKSTQSQHLTEYFGHDSTKNLSLRESANLEKKRGSQQPGIYQSTKNIEIEKKNLSYASNDLSASPQMIAARMTPPRISGHDVSTEHLSSQQNITKQIFKLPSRVASGRQSRCGSGDNAKRDDGNGTRLEMPALGLGANLPQPSLNIQEQQTSDSRVSQLRHRRQNNLQKLMQYTGQKQSQANSKMPNEQQDDDSSMRQMEPPDLADNTRSFGNIAGTSAVVTPQVDESRLKKYAELENIKVSKSSEKLNVNRRSVPQQKVDRIIGKLAPDLSSANVLHSHHDQNSKHSTTSAFKHNYQEIMNSQIITSTSPKFPGIQNSKVNNDSSSVPDTMQMKNNIRYSIDVQPLHARKQSSRKGSIGCSRDLAHLTKYDKQYTNIQDYYQIASAQHSSSKYDSIKSKSKRRKVLLSNKNGQDQMNIFNNDITQKTVYSGKFDSVVTSQTKNWRGDTTPIIGEGHVVEGSHIENEDFKVQEELLSAGTDGNTQYNEIMKKSKLESQKPFSPFPRIPQNNLDYQYQPINVFSQKNFKKEANLTKQCSESGTLAGSPTHHDLSEDNRSSQRIKFSEKQYTYPVKEQLVIQHIRNLKEIHQQRQKHTKNFHHFHKSKVQSPLAINNLDVDQIRSSSNSTAHRSSKMINQYFNHIKNKMQIQSFQNSFQSKQQSKGTTEQMGKEIYQGYQEVGKYLKNMDLPPEDVIPQKKPSSKLEDSVLAESADTPIKEINTSQGTYQNPFVSIFGTVDKKLSSALNFQSNRGITETQLDRFANNKRRYRNASTNVQESVIKQSDSKDLDQHLQVMDESVKQQKRIQDLEKWRKITMTDKLYFLCPTATSKKGRQQLYKSMPPNLNQIKSKVRGQLKKSEQAMDEHQGTSNSRHFDDSKILNDQFQQTGRGSGRPSNECQPRQSNLQRKSTFQNKKASKAEAKRTSLDKKKQAKMQQYQQQNFNSPIQITQLKKANKTQQVNTPVDHEQMQHPKMTSLQDQLLHLEIPEVMFSHRGPDKPERNDSLRKIFTDQDDVPQITIKTRINKKLNRTHNKSSSLHALLKTDNKAYKSAFEKLNLKDERQRYKTIVSKKRLSPQKSPADSFVTKKLSTVNTMQSHRHHHSSKSPVPGRRAALEEMKQRQMQLMAMKREKKKAEEEKANASVNHLQIPHQHQIMRRPADKPSTPQKKQVQVMQFSISNSAPRVRNQINTTTEKSQDVKSPKSNHGIKSLATIIDISDKKEEIAQNMKGLHRSPSKKVSQATRNEDSRIGNIQKALWSKGVYNILDREDVHLTWMEKEEKLCPQLKVKLHLNKGLGDMFAPGAKGNELLAQKMQEVRQEHRTLLRKTLSCVDTRLNDKSQLDQVIYINGFKSESFQMQQCRVRHVIIDNVKNKKQPLTVVFSGVSGDLEAYVSHKYKFPNEHQNHGVFTYTNVITFAPDMIQQGNILTMIDDNEDGNNVPKFRCNQIYLTIETTQLSSSVTANVRFGHGAAKPKSLKEIRKLDSSRNDAAVKSPKSSISAVEEILLNVSLSLEVRLMQKQEQFFELNDGQQAFQLMIVLLHKKFKNVMEKTVLINKEVEKIVSSTETALQFLRQIENLKAQQRAEELAQSTNPEKINQALQEKEVNFIEKNICNLNRHTQESKAIRMLQSSQERQIRQQQSKTLANKNYEDFRQAAIQFLNRNSMFKIQKIIIDHVKLGLKRERKMLKTFCSFVALHKILRIVGSEFNLKKKTWVDTIQKIFAVRKVELKYKKYFDRHGPLFKYRIPGKMRNIPRNAHTLMTNLMMQASEERSHEKIRNFFYDYILVTSANHSMVVFAKKWEFLCHKIKTKQDLERYYKSQGKVSKVGTNRRRAKRCSRLRSIRSQSRNPHFCYNRFYLSQIKKLWIISILLNARSVRQLYYSLIRPMSKKHR